MMLLALVVGIAGDAGAQPPYEFEQTYYTDDTFSQACGYYNQYCQRAEWGGCTTQYYIVEYFSSCDSSNAEEPTECNDGFDNDGDGNRDQWDMGCTWNGKESSSPM